MQGQLYDKVRPTPAPLSNVNVNVNSKNPSYGLEMSGFPTRVGLIQNKTRDTTCKEGIKKVRTRTKEYGSSGYVCKISGISRSVSLCKGGATESG
jgi:hypothetical protein